MIFLSNILLISGTGRNIGKTTLACDLIKYFSEKQHVTGIKISSHLHELDGSANAILKNKYCTISQEVSITNKDSSRMLQAGAKKVYYVQSKKECLKDTFYKLLPLLLKNEPIICESGGLSGIIKPGLFFHVTNETGKVKNQELAKKADKILRQVSGEWEGFDCKDVVFDSGCFQLIF